MSTTQRDTDIKYMYAAYIYLYGYIFIMCRNFKRPQSYSSSWCIFNSCHEAASDICISKIYFLSSYTIQLRQTELTFQHGHIYIQIVTTHMYVYVCLRLCTRHFRVSESRSLEPSTVSFACSLTLKCVSRSVHFFSHWIVCLRFKRIKLSWNWKK